MSVECSELCFEISPTVASASSSEISKRGKRVESSAMTVALALVGPRLLVDSAALISEFWAEKSRRAESRRHA